MGFLTSKEAGDLGGASASRAQHWAAANGVASVGSGKRRVFLWTEEDVAAFKYRNKRKGRPAKSSSGVSPESNQTAVPVGEKESVY